MKNKTLYTCRGRYLLLLLFLPLVLLPLFSSAQNCPLITSHSFVTVSNDGNNNCTYRVDFTMTVNGNNKSVQVLVSCNGSSALNQCIGVNNGQNGQTISTNVFACACNSSKTLVFNSFTNGSCGGASCTTTGNVLPVLLTDFDAKLQQDRVLLSWRTEQEFNNSRFEIERSNDNKTFSAIGSVNGHGNSSIPVDYSFTDATPLKGVSFYRLKQIDIDNQSVYSIIKRVDNRLQGIQIKQLFPNPGHEKVTLNVLAEAPAFLIARIFDNSGKEVFKTQKRVTRGEEYWVLNFRRLTPGLYEVVVTSEAGGVLNEKIIIQ
jgi:hypothetical protein